MACCASGGSGDRVDAHWQGGCAARRRNMRILLLGDDRAKADAYRRAGSRLPVAPRFRYEPSFTPRAISRAMKPFRDATPTVVLMRQVGVDTFRQLAEQNARILYDPPTFGFPICTWNLINIVERLGTWTLPMMPLRMMPVLQRIKEIVNAGSLGQLLYLKATYNERLPSDSSRIASALVARGCHAIDLVNWLLGDDYADVQVVSGKGLSNAADISEDMAILSFLMEDKSYATVDISWSLPSAYPKRASITIEMAGTGGNIRSDALKQSLHLSSAEPSRELYWGGDIYTEALRILTAADDAPPPVTLEDLGHAQNLNEDLIYATVS
ncbi:MAG: hypothetical protein F4W97_00070 [Chloroflexi bacterium]|nr:hypothetical protein [Chloroflexota bacterium]